MADPLWITYAWVDDEEGDFTHLLAELRRSGVKATYDKVAIVPGQRLWDQIGEKIINSALSGWAYLLTPNSLLSEACREELAYALYRAMTDKGADFPLIGLLHGVGIDDVPPPLKIRLCVSLTDPNWREQIKAGVESRPPKVASKEASRFVWRIHNNYQDNLNCVAVEVRPRFGSIVYWRFVVPSSAVIVQWGVGPAGGGGISGISTNRIEGGAGNLAHTPCLWFGAGDALSPSISAYVAFSGELPQFVAFGQANEPFGQPIDPLEMWRREG